LTVIVAALAPACGLAAYPLLRMIRGRPKGLLAVTATAVVHRAAPGESGTGSFSLEAPKRAVLAKKFQRVETTDFWPVFAGKATLLSTGSVTSAFDR